MGLTVTTGPANAAEPIGPRTACPDDPTIIWRGPFAGTKNVMVFEGVEYTILAANPTFYASDGRVVENNLDSPISATFTSSQSQTYTVTVTVGFSSQLVQNLQTSVSTSITSSRTTAIGVNAAVTVPPHSRVIGLYGIEAYDVTYDAHRVWRNAGNNTICYEQGTSRGTTQAPTFVEGWRFNPA
ncbi:hypothetical protein [Micromonospora wenchangensis]|uniref:hypothetical protein n=1 Tax=Micromonospora wenchangensis TaxID=1185415 RepID=UPI003D741C1E